MAAVLVAVALLAAGCTPKEDPVTPEEARDSLTTITHDTADLLDVPGWSPQSDAYASSCDDGDGVSWAYAYSAPMPDSAPMEDAQTIADYWEGLGMTVRVTTDGTPSVYATGGPLSGIRFATGPGTYAIAGTSLCASGDADDYR